MFNVLFIEAIAHCFAVKLKIYKQHVDDLFFPLIQQRAGKSNYSSNRDIMKMIGNRRDVGNTFARNHDLCLVKNKATGDMREST